MPKLDLVVRVTDDEVMLFALIIKIRIEMRKFGYVELIDQFTSEMNKCKTVEEGYAKIKEWVEVDLSACDYRF